MQPTTAQNLPPTPTPNAWSPWKALPWALATNLLLSFAVLSLVLSPEPLFVLQDVLLYTALLSPLILLGLFGASGRFKLIALVLPMVIGLAIIGWLVSLFSQPNIGLSGILVFILIMAVPVGGVALAISIFVGTLSQQPARKKVAVGILLAAAALGIAAQLGFNLIS